MRLVCLFLICCSLSAAELRVPEGFVVERAVQAGAVRFPMFAALDERGRLFVAESSGLDLYEELQKQTRRCQISLLEDVNGDGLFEKATIFGERLVFPMGLAWRDGKLYAADPPDLITLEDTDGDGRADRRRVILSGFGHTDNGSLHGLTFGPDGWLYLTMGQPDGYRFTRGDGSVLEGKSGALLRCKPDGTGVEVLCRGFENLVEVVFLPGGEMLGTDNWFFLPRDGVRDALVHLVPGGLYPLNAHPKFEAGMFASGVELPPVQVYPAVALSGLMRYEGAAFPKMHGHLFSAQFNTRKVVRHEFARKGASFESRDEDFLTTEDPDFHPSDVLEAADGSLLVVDTGSWYVHHCPTGRIRNAPAEGGIYRVRYGGRIAKEAIPAMSVEDRSARDARQGKLGEGELVELLRQPSKALQLAAAEALAQQGSEKAVPKIVEALVSSESEPMLQHALTFALHHRADAEALTKLLGHPEGAVRRAAVVLLDQAPHNKLRISAAMGALRSEHPELRAAGLAAFAKHPEWRGGLSAFAKELLESGGAGLKEVLPLVAGEPALRAAMVQLIENEGGPVAARVQALELAGRGGVMKGGEFEGAIRRALRSEQEEVLRRAIGEAQTMQLRGAEEELRRISESEVRSEGVRLESLRALVRAEPVMGERSFEFVLGCLALTNPAAMRLKAAETVASAKLSARQFAAFLDSVSKDWLISPNVAVNAARRGSVEGDERLLAYLSRAVETGWRMPDETRSWLEGIEGAKGIVNQAVESAANDQERLRAFEPLLRGGDPNRGHQVFLGKSGCAACHQVGKVGGLLGPDLTRIGAIRAGRDLLESLVLPSATIAQGYDTYHLELADGASLTGVRVRQADDAFVLRDAAGSEIRLEPARLRKADRSPISLMPEGLLNGLDREEVRDLLAFLQGLK